MNSQEPCSLVELLNSYMEENLGSNPRLYLLYANKNLGNMQNACDSGNWS